MYVTYSVQIEIAIYLAYKLDTQMLKLNTDNKQSLSTQSRSQLLLKCNYMYMYV